mmetsp:Transcript_61371/g.101411  ORF Transcript_61371/g.101411 Transcript_61371/m.101411 type:complete len:207 (-) Transcript_61371:398-1018(-)
MLKVMFRLPLSKGLRCRGMPSPGMLFTAPGLQTSPGWDFTSSVRPSRCFRGKENPHSASLRLMVFSMERSMPFRLKRSCFCSCNTMYTSPGLMSGCWSPSSENLIFSPLAMPLSMWTSMVRFSVVTRSPEHLVHRSPAFTDRPSPRQALQGTCICCTMGPICRTITCTPEPRQSEQVVDCPDLEPEPLHCPQSTCLVHVCFSVLPL